MIAKELVEEIVEEKQGRGQGKTRELSLIETNPIVNILIRAGQGTIIRDDVHGNIESIDGKKKYRLK